jgi:hypothetical protein
MDESPEDLASLQARLDRSHAGMGAHMRSIITPERRLNARQLAAHLQAIKHVALSTVNERGEPRIGVLDGIFLRGRFHVGTAANAVRTRHLRAQPRVSLAYYVGDEIGVTVHGQAKFLPGDHPDIARLASVYVAAYGASPYDMGIEVVTFLVEPDTMYAYAPHPERFPE